MGKCKGLIRTKKLVGLSLAYEFRNPALYLFLAFMFGYLIYTFSGTSSWLSEHGDSLNLFELYTYFSCGYFTKFLYKIGIALFSCGIFYFSPGYPYYLVRTDKKTWVRGQVIYLLCIVVFINLFIFAVLVLASGGHITLHNSWSDAAYAALSIGPYEVGIDGVSMSYPDLFVYNPNLVGLLNMLYMVLEGMSAGLLMVWLTARKKTVYAVAFIFGGYYLNFNLIDELYKICPPVRLWRHISPFEVYDMAKSTWNAGRNSIAYTVIYGVVVIGILIMLYGRTVHDVEFAKSE